MTARLTPLGVPGWLELTDGGQVSLDELFGGRVARSSTPRESAARPPTRTGGGTLLCPAPHSEVPPRSARQDESKAAKGCGLALVQRHLSDPRRGRVIRVGCKAKHCPDCGARGRTEKIGTYLPAMRALRFDRVAFVATAEWSHYAERTLAGGAYYRVPSEGGFLVFNAQIGDVIGDLDAALREALEGDPCDGRHCTPSRALRATAAVSADAPTPAQEDATPTSSPTYSTVGIACRGLRKAFELARVLGTILDDDGVVVTDAGALKADELERFAFVFPDEAAWASFEFGAQVVSVEEAARRRARRHRRRPPTGAIGRAVAA